MEEIKFISPSELLSALLCVWVLNRSFNADLSGRDGGGHILQWWSRIREREGASERKRARERERESPGLTFI